MSRPPPPPPPPPPPTRQQIYVKSLVPSGLDYITLPDIIDAFSRGTGDKVKDVYRPAGEGNYFFVELATREGVLAALNVRQIKNYPIHVEESAKNLDSSWFGHAQSMGGRDFTGRKPLPVWEQNRFGAKAGAGDGGWEEGGGWGRELKGPRWGGGGGGRRDSGWGGEGGNWERERDGGWERRGGRSRSRSRERERERSRSPSAEPRRRSREREREREGREESYTSSGRRRDKARRNYGEDEREDYDHRRRRRDRSRSPDDRHRRSFHHHRRRSRSRSPARSSRSHQHRRRRSPSPDSRSRQRSPSRSPVARSTHSNRRPSPFHSSSPEGQDDTPSRIRERPPPRARAEKEDTPRGRMSVETVEEELGEGDAAMGEDKREQVVVEDEEEMKGVDEAEEVVCEDSAEELEDRALREVSTLIVRNLAPSCDAERLQQFASQSGLLDVVQTGAHAYLSGEGFIEYADAQTANRALYELNGRSLEGEWIRLQRV